MSELERRRDARDLWVSRSHLHAGVVFAVVLAMGTFSAGYYVGKGQVRAAESPRYASLVGEVPGTELVELLAQVERTKVVHASAAIEYPTFAEDEEGLHVPGVQEAPAAPGVDAVVEAPPLAQVPEVDAVPEGAFTVAVGRFSDEDAARGVRDHLRAQGHAAWLSLRLVEGEPELGVAVGGFADREEADAVRGLVAADVGTAPVAVGSPEVVELTAW